MQDDISFTHRNIVNVLMVSKLDTYLRALKTRILQEMIPYLEL